MRFLILLILSSFSVGCATAQNKTIAIKRTALRSLANETPKSGEYQCVLRFENTSDGSLASRFQILFNKDTYYAKIDPPGTAAPILIEESPRSGIVASFWGVFGEFNAKFYRRTGDIMHYENGEADFDEIKGTESLGEIRIRGKDATLINIGPYKLSIDCG